jgi:serine/threonine protein kinase
MAANRRSVARICVAYRLHTGVVMGKRIIRATGKVLLGDFKKGQQIGDYVIDEELPSSGTGILYAGHHVAVAERLVVLRIVPAAAPPFQDVAFQLDELHHPGTPRIFDTGVLPDHRRWVAVEHITGSTVADVITHRTMSNMECLALLRDVCEVLAHAHGKGIVHGNIRPENIVVPDDRRTTICLVGWEGARRETTTSPAPFVRGTEYTAPEQLRGDPDDARTDAYALGVIVHRALHGVLPHERTGKKSGLLETLIDQMLCGRPDLRPSSARIRAAVAYLCSASQIDKRQSWIVPTVALNLDAIEEQTEVADAESIASMKLPWKS